MNNNVKQKLLQIFKWLLPVVIGLYFLNSAFEDKKDTLNQKGIEVDSSFFEILVTAPTLIFATIFLFVIPGVAYLLPESISDENKFRFYLYGSLIAITSFILFIKLA